LYSGARVYVAGNGGSASIANHLTCDWMKGTHVTGKPALKVHSLGSNGTLLTAIANDFGFEESFAHQVELLGEAGDLLVLISSSGNSANIVRALEVARLKRMKIIGLTGFTGGKLKELCDVSLHVPVHNYGIVEDTHQSLMHCLAQFLEKSR
jgi:phosphoheptose isomerase